MMVSEGLPNGSPLPPPRPGPLWALARIASGRAGVLREPTIKRSLLLASMRGVPVPSSQSQSQSYLGLGCARLSCLTNELDFFLPFLAFLFF